MIVMLDIETLGTSSNSLILSIGATTNTGKTFEVLIDPESCEEFGLKIDARTVMWWMSQSDKAREIFNSGDTDPLDVALEKFAKWINWSKVDEAWCNGTDFDFVILENAFKACGMSTPWPYWVKRDLRTVKKCFNRKDLEAKPTVTHSALADAQAQMLTLANLRGAYGF